MGLHHSNALEGKNSAIEMLRAAARLPLRNELQAYLQISDAVQSAETAVGEPQRGDLDDWVYRLALIYKHQTGLLPAFSNCENETRFERFVHALPAPARLQLTRNRLKASIRRLDLRNNAEFARDLDALNESGAPPNGPGATRGSLSTEDHCPL